MFIANSKTASTSIEAALTPYAEINRVGSPQRKHISWQKARREYSFLFDQPNYSPDNFFKFGIIREPADWIRSWFNYSLDNSKVETALPRWMTFDEFWKRHGWLKTISQKSKFLNEKGDFGFDVILPQEYINELFPIITDMLGVNVKLPRKNKSPGKLKREDISTELWSAINSYYQEDYDFYLDWKKRAGDVLAEVATVSRYGYQLSTEHSYGGKIETSRAKNLQLEIRPSALVAECALNPGLLQHMLQGSKIKLGGIVVLKPDVAQQYKLVATDSQGDHVITWGIASPRIAEKHIGNPHAAYSRFNVDGLLAAVGRPIQILLEDAVGQRDLLFSIS